MTRVLWSDYAYPGLVAGCRSLGWDIEASDDYAYSVWCWGREGRERSTSREFGRFLRDAALRIEADVLVVGKGCDSNRRDETVEPPFFHLYREDVQQIRAAGTALVLLDLDVPDSFSFVRDCGLMGAADSYGICCIGARDHIARYTEGEVWEFWPAWDQLLRETIPARADRPVDLVMIGSPYVNPNPEFGLARRDVVRAALDVGLVVEVYGDPLWLSPEFGDPSFAPFFKGRAAWHEVHAIMGRSKIGYNSFLRRGFRYLNDRPFIVAGAGAFLLSEEQLGIDAVFREREHCGYHRYRDVASLRAELAYWMAHEEERLEAAENLQRFVLAEHTYANRAEVLVAATNRALERTEARRKKGCCR